MKLKIKKTELNKFRNTTQGFGFGKSAQRSRENSLKGERRDPMRESTMYFLKHAFNAKQQSSNLQDDDDDDFYKSMIKKNKNDERSHSNDRHSNNDEDSDKNIDNHSNPRGPMSLLKSRRFSNRKLHHKENQSPRKKTGAGVNMSSDIKSLI